LPRVCSRVTLCASPPTCLVSIPVFLLFNATPPTEIYTLSLHDALPICHRAGRRVVLRAGRGAALLPQAELPAAPRSRRRGAPARSEEHTSELQSLTNLVCRLLLEKKKKSHIHRTVRRLAARRVQREQSL